MNSINHRKIVTISLYAFPALGYLLSILLFIPIVREMIIGYGETHIVHRALTHPVWHGRMIEWGCISVFISSLLVLIIKAFFDDICRMVVSLFQKDLGCAIQELWAAIPELYKKSFCVVYIGLNLVFAFHTINFLWGTHDWWLLFSSRVPLIGQVGIGRYFYYVFTFVFMNGHFLPVLTNLMTFLFFALAAVLLCFYWKLPKSVLIYSTVGLLFVLQPYTIERMWGMGEGQSYMTLGFFVLVAFILGEKSFTTDSRLKRLGLILFAALSFWFAIGAYPVVVSTIAVIFIGRLVIEFVSAEDGDRSVIKIIKPQSWTVVSIIIALFFHLIVIKWLEQSGRLSTESYMTTTLGLRDMPLRLAEIAKASFGYLLDYKRPFFPRSFTLIFTGLLLVLVSAVCVKIIRAKIPFSTRLIDVLLFIVFCYAALIFSFASNFITKTDTLFWPRIDFFGIAYFHIFILAVLFKQRNKFVKNISLLSCFVLIYVCAISAFYAMKVWKLGFDAEKMEWNRIIARIEMTAGYQDDKDYQVIILGSTRAYRPYFYDGKYHQDDMLDHSYMPPWASEWKVRVFYAYTVHSKNGIWLQIDLDSQPGEFKKLIAKMPDEIENAEAWPSLKSIFIKDDLMLIALNQAELDRVKQLLK